MENALKKPQKSAYFCSFLTLPKTEGIFNKNQYKAKGDGAETPR